MNSKKILSGVLVTSCIAAAGLANAQTYATSEPIPTVGMIEISEEMFQKIDKIDREFEVKYDALFKKYEGKEDSEAAEKAFDELYKAHIQAFKDKLGNSAEAKTFIEELENPEFDDFGEGFEGDFEDEFDYGVFEELPENLQKIVEQVEDSYERKFEALEKKYEGKEDSVEFDVKLGELADAMMKELTEKLGNSDEAKAFIEELESIDDEAYIDYEYEDIDTAYDDLPENLQKVVNDVEEDFEKKFEALYNKYEGKAADDTFEKELEALIKNMNETLKRKLGDSAEAKAFIAELEAIELEDMYYEDDAYDYDYIEDEMTEAYVDAFTARIGTRLDNVSNEKLEAIIAKVHKLEDENKGNEKMLQQLEALEIVLLKNMEQVKVKLDIDLDSLLK